MAEHPRVFDTEDPLVAQVRALCLGFPDAVEVETWGHPTFRVGKRIFAGVNSIAEHPHAVVFKADPDDRRALAQDPRFFKPPYSGPKGWLAIGIDDPSFDWELLGELIDASFRQVALKGQVRELDAR